MGINVYHYQRNEGECLGSYLEMQLLIEYLRDLSDEEFYNFYINEEETVVEVEADLWEKIPETHLNKDVKQDILVEARGWNDDWVRLEYEC